LRWFCLDGLFSTISLSFYASFVPRNVRRQYFNYRNYAVKLRLRRLTIRCLGLRPATGCPCPSWFARFGGGQSLIYSKPCIERERLWQPFITKTLAT
jgi:hypothetical protein